MSFVTILLVCIIFLLCWMCLVNKFTIQCNISQKCQKLVNCTLVENFLMSDFFINSSLNWIFLSIIKSQRLKGKGSELQKSERQQLKRTSKICQCMRMLKVFLKLIRTLKVRKMPSWSEHQKWERWLIDQIIENQNVKKNIKSQTLPKNTFELLIFFDAVCKIRKSNLSNFGILKKWLNWSSSV